MVSVNCLRCSGVAMDSKLSGKITKFNWVTLSGFDKLGLDFSSVAQADNSIPTHNPNIVVLGDSDQVIECQFLDRQFNLNMAAGIDDKAVQSVVINIMEGGEEALKTRTRFYQNANSWKH